jgi:hypothetical protein
MKISYTVSRGSIVDEDGLVQVLKEGKIGRSRINDVLVHTAVGDTRPRTPVAPQLARYSAELRCQIRDGTDAAARRRVPRRSVQRGPGSTGKPAQKCYIWRRSGQLAVAATRIIPVVRGPDVAGRVDRHVGEHLDTAALENVDDIAGLGARRVPRAPKSRGSSRLAVLLLRLWVRPESRIPTAEYGVRSWSFCSPGLCQKLVIGIICRRL